MPDPTFTTPPSAPSRAVPSTFSSLTDAFLAWMVTFQGELATAVTWFSSTASTVSTDAGSADTAAATAAASATAALANAGAALHVPSASYTAGDAAISNTDYQTYRAILTHTGVATDPSADATNWVKISGGEVTLAGVETLTNKTLTAPAITNPAITAPTITGTVIEDVFALTGTTPALEPANGSIQTWTLTAAATPTDSLAAGEAITLMIDDGTAYTITWPTITWINNAGSAPTLATTGYTVIALWKVSTTLYGALVGDGS